MSNDADAPKYCPADDKDAQYGGARQVVEAEFGHIRKWRGLEDKDPSTGIALSGGGIRSASFGLGVLQALAKGEWLREFDYLSTVSGGGYTGSSLSYLLHLSRTNTDGGVPKFDVSQNHFPYVSCPMVGAREACRDEAAPTKKGGVLRRLRQNAKYLTPGNGITLLSLIGVVVRNSLTSLLVHGGLIVLVLLLLIGLDFLQIGEAEWPLTWSMNPVLWASAGLFGLYGLLSGLYVFLSGFFDALFLDEAVYGGRWWYERSIHWMLAWGIALFVVGALPWLHTVVKHAGILYSAYAGAVSSFLGAVSSVWAFLKSSDVKKPTVPMGVVVALASVLLLLGAVLLAFSLTLWLEAPNGVWVALALTTVFLFFVGWIPSVNYVSIHRYYRDRLMETFMPDKHGIANPEAPCGKTHSGNETMLGDTFGGGTKDDRPDKKRGPFHLICTNVVLVSSGNPRYRGRGGDSFVFSPVYAGSNATGWVKTDSSPGAGMTLATAMAISGAAVNPNAGCGGEGVTRQPVLSVLMSMLNIRLGYWWMNPNRSVKKTAEGVTTPVTRSLLNRILFKPNMLYPGVLESFGRRYLREEKRYVLLTDGGHFENLGLYELIRRRLKVIVVCDGAADPDYTFGDLANAIEKARADFGALVDINSADLEDLIPRADREDSAQGKPDMPAAKRGYLAAPIKYAAVPVEEGKTPPNTCGLLIYITTTFFKELDASLHGYRQAHPAFPDEPTSDQFFDEKQFESYRELGFQTAWHMMNAFSDSKKKDPDLNGVAFPRIHKKEHCTKVPKSFQQIRESIRDKLKQIQASSKEPTA